MEVKYTKQFLSSLEDIFAESDYTLRYEKGNFKSGYCLLKDTKIAIINKYFPLEGRINSLIEIIKSTQIDTSNFSNKSQQIYSHIVQN